VTLKPSGARPTGKVNPITFEVLRSAFAAVSNEVGLVIAKTAYSTSVNGGRDFPLG